MENKLFRQESVDRISSPEQLNDYMRVTSPRLWMLLAAIAVLLVGFIVYAATATLESTMPLKVTVDYSAITAGIPVESLEVVKLHTPVRIAGRTGFIEDIYQVGRLELTLTFDGDKTLEDGSYEMQFVNTEDLPESMSSGTEYVMVTQGRCTIYDTVETREVFRNDVRVRVGGNLATVTSTRQTEMAILSISIDADQEPLADGIYEAEIVTESTTPISFLLN